MENKKTNQFEYSFSVDMKFGPVIIPKEHQVSKKIAIEYILEQFKDYVRENSVFMFDKKGNEKGTMFLNHRDAKDNKEFFNQ